MTQLEQAILAGLLELEAAVTGLRATPPTPSLEPHLVRLQALTRELPPGTDPTLRHYLQKQSWEKARRLLQGRDFENATGNCRHV